MDKHNLALIEELLTEFRNLKAKVNKGLSLSDEERVRLDGILDSLEENGALNQITDELNASRGRRGIRPDVSYNPYPASAYRGNKGEFFSSLGEQLQCIYQAAQSGQKPDERLFKVNEKEIRAATGLGEAIPSTGGFLLEGSFTTDLVKETFETGQLAKLCMSFPINRGNSIKIPAFAETSRVTGSRLGGIRGYWLAESGTKTGSKPAFRSMELTLKKLIGLCYASDELLDDAQLLERVIRKGFTSEFGFLVDDSILNGSGTGMPLGVMNATSLITVSRNTASSIKYQDLTGMWSRLLPGSGKRSVFLINQDVIPELLAMTIGTSEWPVYIPANSAANAPYDTLLGRPVLQCEQCQTLGTKGDVVLADFAEGYVLGEKPGGIQFASSIHVNYVQDETAFRFVLRLDGQPVLSTAITPAHGSNTLGHFIVLS
jgi:HK97 family phage major capsid protein